MQPSRASQQYRRPSIPTPRSEVRAGPYPGPYAVNYRGPDRPFPEVGGRRGIPLVARLAAWLGLISLVPLALFVVTAIALGGLRSDAGPEWWLYPLLAAPLVQLWGAVDLLGGRSWRVLALGCLPGTLLVAWLLAGTLGGNEVLGLGWWVLALAGSPVTLFLTLLPPVRRWVADRRRPPRHAVV